MDADNRVRGEGILRLLERGLLAADALVERFVAPEHNPLKLTGAIAMLGFVVATASGVLLLLWYTPSLGGAHASVVAMGEQPWTAGLARSLHRYGSDVAVAFALLHMLRLFVERRFTGTRWWAWLTGVIVVLVLWLVGWTGYWLVWDERAHRVAVGSARMLDVLPVFVDPLSRAFLTDGGVNSLLFFVIFFAHMLIPMGVIGLLWLHIARLSRPMWITGRAASAWACGAMVLLSLLWPANTAEPAQMAALEATFTMDAWYLAPIALMDRLGPTGLWALFLGTGVVLVSLPWTLLRGPAHPAAEVVEARCNACHKCYQDCPYDAIDMVPRTDGHARFEQVSFVDPAKCVSCGICAGSCDSAGIGIPWFDSLTERKALDGWLKEDEEIGAASFVLFACQGNTAGLGIDPATGRAAALPGWRVEALPCAGWVHMLTIERAVRRGARGVLLTTCAEGACRYREGDRWTRDRFEGRREPSLRDGVGDKARLAAVRGAAHLLAEARAFEGSTAASSAWRAPAAVGAMAVVLLSTVAVAVGSDLPYWTPTSEPGSELVVSMKAAGNVGEQCRTLGEEEKAALPIHMRRDEICERSRATVRLKIEMDGAAVREVEVEPNGIWKDGASIAIERVSVQPGPHDVRVSIADDLDGTWTHVATQTLDFEAGRRHVVEFGTATGFQWH